MASNLDKQTVDMLKTWLAMHNGNVEELARWMRDSLRVGGLKACRAMILEAAGR